MKHAADIPVIETERLRLRGFAMRDYEAVAAYKADPDVMRYTGGPEDRYRAWKSFTAMAGTWNVLGFGYFCIADKQTDACLGHSALLQPPEWPDREVGYTLARGAHGKGYAVEAASAVLRFAYEHMGWTTAVSVIDPQNRASQNVARKMGALLERENEPVWDFRADIWRHQPPERFLAS
ncbi:GNAT family N-acetyltransferase [Oricola sp.]|uniref:GNAT family N-acetyltransferase n=1 Tax=Oricola sp. TaxID=1979950 RepID=UPI003BA8504A